MLEKVTKTKLHGINKAIVIVLIATVILGVLYVSNVRILVGDNWIVYAFVRGIETYGLESFSELSLYYKSYITYYPIPLWAISSFLKLNPITVDLAIFLVLFPSMAILTYIVVNTILAEKTASAIAMLLFLFGGGSAWIARLLYTNKFWTASYLSLDANFGDNWLVTGLWAYKGLSLFLSFCSTLLFIKIYLSKEQISRTKSILHHTVLLLCISLSILDYPYGILFVIGTTLITSLFAGLLKTKTHHKLQLRKALTSILIISLMATLIVVNVDIVWGTPLKIFVEDRLTRFYSLNLNAYVIIFLVLFGGLILSIYLYESASTIASHIKHRELSLNEKNNEKNVFLWTVGILICIAFSVVIFGITSWLVNPKPQEYLLTLTNWPLKYTIARYSFLFLLALFTTIVAYNRGYIHVALVNLLSVILVIIAGTLVPLPVKTRTLVFLKLALVITIGYGISKIRNVEKEYIKSKKLSYKPTILRLKLTSLCLIVFLIFSTMSSGYFWYNVLQAKYPVYEMEVSSWVISNTPANMNLRFLTTPEWLTIKSIEWLAAKPNVAPIESDEINKAIDIILENAQEYGRVYIVVYKSSEVGKELDDILALLEMNGIIISIHENNAYKVYMTTDKLDDLLERAENLTHPLPRKPSSHV